MGSAESRWQIPRDSPVYLVTVWFFNRFLTEPAGKPYGSAHTGFPERSRPCNCLTSEVLSQVAESAMIAQPRLTPPTPTHGPKRNFAVPEGVPETAQNTTHRHICSAQMTKPHAYHMCIVNMNLGSGVYGL
jgi:hypothetical protein